MRTFEVGDKVRCINSSSRTTFNESTEFLKQQGVYTVSAINAFHSDRIRLKEGGNNYSASRFELVNQEIMNKPFVFVQPSKDAQPLNNVYRAVLYLPAREGAVKQEYIAKGKSLAGEFLSPTWGVRTDSADYRYRTMEGEFATAQQALDAGEKALREVFQPTPVPAPAPNETIRYVEL